MTVTTKTPEKEYPYLAVWNNGEPLSLEQVKNINKESIVLISKVIKNNDENVDGYATYVQYLLGGKEGFITKNEEEYFPLPQGYTATFVQ